MYINFFGIPGIKHHSVETFALPQQVDAVAVIGALFEDENESRGT